MKFIPKAIIFDWDNTLLDTFPIIQDAINETMEHMGHEPWSLQKVKQDVNKSMRESFPDIFGDDWQEAGKVYQDSYKRNHLNNLVMFPYALELIQKVNNLGIKAFVVSNKVGKTLRDEVNKLELTDKFFNVIGAHDAKLDKPSKYPVEMALEYSDLDPNKDLIWFMGDSFVDIECALNSNCQPVLFNEENKLSQDLIIRANSNKEKPLLEFSNHKDIIEYLS